MTKQKINKILIVDDLNSNLDLLSNYLSEEEYVVATVNSAKSALAKIKSHRFDIILLDINMPDMNGIELCKVLKENDATKNIPIIFLTAINSQDVIIEAFKAGGVDYIQKPFNVEELKMKIGNHLKLVNYQRQLESAIEIADLSNKAKSNFLSNISHELKTPLNGIVCTLEMMSETQLNRKQNELLNIATESATYLTNILNDILDLTNIESGQIEKDNENFNIRNLINESIKAFQSRIIPNMAKIYSHISIEIPEIIYGNKFRTMQVLKNLIDNALKYSDSEKIDVNLSISSETQSHCILKFEIQDYGKGLTSYQQNIIFNNFTQIDDQNNRKTSGIGSGLAISRKIVEYFGGELSVKSEIGKGSTFYYTIKYKKIKGLDFQDKAFKTPSDIYEIPKLKILVVDDNSINLKVANMIITKMGYISYSATNGKEAVEKHLSFLPDIIFMDIQMPEMDGMEATRKIRLNEIQLRLSPIPIVALTASAIKGDKELYLASGMNDYITKPFKKSDIEETIKKYFI